MRVGLVIGVEDFIGKMKKQQMSGRPYLKTDTGNFKRSWRVKSGVNPVFMWANTYSEAKYGPPHQFSATIRPKTKDYLTFKIGKKWIRTDVVYIPKRLYLFESFRQEGGKIIMRNIRKEFKKADVFKVIFE